MVKRRQTAQRLIEAVAEQRGRRGRRPRLGRKLTPEQRERRRQEALDILWQALPLAAKTMADEVGKGNFQAAVRIMEVLMGNRSEQGQNIELLAAMSQLARALEADASLRREGQEGAADAGAGVQEAAIPDGGL